MRRRSCTSSGCTRKARSAADGRVAGREHPAGIVRVHVRTRPKPVVLFLSSYEPVQWELSLDAGARLSRVFTQGYHEQTVVGAPANTTIVQQGPEGACGYACGWEVRHNSGGGSFLGMIGHARLATGLSESSFRVATPDRVSRSPFRDGDSQLDRPGPLPGDETLAREEVRFPGCEAILRERDGYCLTALRRRAGGHWPELGDDVFDHTDRRADGVLRGGFHRLARGVRLLLWHGRAHPRFARRRQFRDSEFVV